MALYCRLAVTIEVDAVLAFEPVHFIPWKEVEGPQSEAQEAQPQDIRQRET
jgi:hypothetical protein